MLPWLEGLADSGQADRVDAEVLGQALGQRRPLANRMSDALEEPPEELRELVNRRLVIAMGVLPLEGPCSPARTPAATD